MAWIILLRLRHFTTVDAYFDFPTAAAAVVPDNFERNVRYDRDRYDNNHRSTNNSDILFDGKTFFFGFFSRKFSVASMYCFECLRFVNAAHFVSV